MKNVLKLIFLLEILRGCSACKHEPSPIQIVVPEKVVENTDPCRLNQARYNDAVKVILSINCIECHNNGRQAKGYNFEGYTNSVQSFLRDTHHVLSVIRHEDYPNMPPSTKLSDCKIRQIETWVKEGFKEN